VKFAAFASSCSALGWKNVLLRTASATDIRHIAIGSGVTDGGKGASPPGQAWPLADWTDCFQSGPAPKGAPATLTNWRKITLSTEAACAAQSRGPQYFLSVGPVAAKITFNCGAYYTQYLISGGIECCNSWIYWVLLRYRSMSLLERWNLCLRPP